MSLETYKETENRYLESATSLETKLNSLKHLTDANEQKKVLNNCQRSLYEARGTLSQLEKQLRSLDFSLRQSAQGRLRKYLRNIHELNERFSTASQQLTTGGRMDSNVEHMEQRQRLIQSSRTVDSTTASLERTQAMLARTTHTGIETQAQLIQQREQLLNATDNLDETNTILGRSKSILRTMRRRIMTNKIIQVVIILLELGLIGLIVYLKCCK